MTIENIYGIFCYLILILIFLVPIIFSFWSNTSLKSIQYPTIQKQKKESSIHNHFSRGVLVVLGFAIVTRRGTSLGVNGGFVY